MSGCGICLTHGMAALTSYKHFADAHVRYNRLLAKDLRQIAEEAADKLDGCNDASCQDPLCHEDHQLAQSLLEVVGQALNELDALASLRKFGHE